VTVHPNPEWCPTPQRRYRARFSEGLELLGFDLQGRPIPGRQLRVTAFLRTRQPSGDVMLRLSLDGPSGEPVCAVESVPFAGRYPPSKWPPGEIFPVSMSLPLPAATDVSQARLRMQVVSSTGQPLEARWGWWGRGRAVDLFEMDLEFPAPTPGTRSLASLDDRIMLLSYESTEAVAPGGVVRVTFYWWAMTPMDEDYAVFAHLLDEEGRVKWQHDGMPVFGTRPTGGWQPGEVIVDVHEIHLPADALEGTYPLEVGIYSPLTWQRLHVLDQEGTPRDDHLYLHPVRVVR
jgi:hypothetical protein